MSKGGRRPVIHVLQHGQVAGGGPSGIGGGLESRKPSPGLFDVLVGSPTPERRPLTLSSPRVYKLRSASRSRCRCGP